MAKAKVAAAVKEAAEAATGEDEEAKTRADTTAAETSVEVSILDGRQQGRDAGDVTRAT